MALFGDVAPSAQNSSDVSLDEKIGQMILAGFRGLEATPDLSIVQDIQNHHIGGILLFDFDVPTGSPVRNVQSPDQLRKLVYDLQSISSTPLLVTIDQEGGQINRLKHQMGFPRSVSAQYLGQKDDVKLTHRRTSTMAEGMARVGINLNLAPVVDLNRNPRNPIIGRRKRSFSKDPDIVTKHAVAYIDAHHEQGVLCCLKHFPGHGSSATDTHRDLTDVTQTWHEEELTPYRQMIQMQKADSIMTSHVFHADLDPEYPATLSARILTDLLRKDMGYNGVIITDDMQMAAISKYYGFEFALQTTISAGSDIITLGNNQVFEGGLIERAVSLIKAMVADGRISEARIDASYQRIRQLKSKLEY